MKKLNNKGFAISTMLYGILTMIILVFTLLLSIMKASYNKENAAADNITYYLNKCISKQVALEDCYKTYDDDSANPKSCSEEYEAYTTCIGKSSTLGSNSSTTIRLYKLAIDLTNESSTGLVVDSLETNGTRYIFTGTSPKNYIKYGNKTGRIISLEPDNKIKVVFTDTFDGIIDPEISTSQSSLSIWENSKMIATLGTKVSSISYSDKFITGKFYTGAFYESNTVTDTLTSITSESSTKYKYGLISVADYLKASNNSNCDLTSGTITDALTKCGSNNWLTTGAGTCYWTMTGVVSGGQVTNYVTIKNSSNYYALTAPTTTCSIGIVVYLPATTTVGTTGDGSTSNPFVVSLS